MRVVDVSDGTETKVAGRSNLLTIFSKLIFFISAAIIVFRSLSGESNLVDIKLCKRRLPEAPAITIKRYTVVTRAESAGLKLCTK